MAKNFRNMGRSRVARDCVGHFTLHGSIRNAARRCSRYSFVATTELTDPVHAVRLSGRVTEISRNGCYVNALNALPIGTLLNLEISCDLGKFTTKGRIIYIHPGIGMGIAFLDTSDSQMQILGL